MTRKQALEHAVAALSGVPNSSEAIQILQQLSAELPIVHWSNASIRDSVDQFIADNGRLPKCSDFKKAGLPPPSVIKQKYKMPLAEWLEQNYQVENKSAAERRDENIKNFIKEYNALCPTSSYDFNNRKSPAVSTWMTIAKYYNTNSWRELLHLLDLPVFRAEPKQLPKQKFTVRIHTDYDFTD